LLSSGKEKSEGEKEDTWGEVNMEAEEEREIKG
jgi:hypothetical protein